MNREKILLGLLGALGLYALLYYTVLSESPEDILSADKPIEDNPLTKIMSVKKITPRTPDTLVDNRYEWDKDLFSGTVIIETSGLSEDIGYELTGIEFSESSSAIIDGEPVRIGSFFQGFQVIEITKNQVVLYGNRENLVLSLGKGSSTTSSDANYLFMEGFNEAFRVARIKGLNSFEYKGRVYHTRLKSEQENN